MSLKSTQLYRSIVNGLLRSVRRCFDQAAGEGSFDQLKTLKGIMEQQQLTTDPLYETIDTEIARITESNCRPPLLDSSCHKCFRNGCDITFLPCAHISSCLECVSEKLSSEEARTLRSGNRLQLSSFSLQDVNCPKCRTKTNMLVLSKR